MQQDRRGTYENESPSRRSADRSASEDSRRMEGDKDAEPSNTASNSCNGDYFKPLRWGVDSLYLSFSGELRPDVERRLKDLKAIAQSAEAHEQAYAQLPVLSHVFEVKDKGAGLFPYILEDNAFRLQLSRPGKKLPMAYVKVSSEYLCHTRPADVETHLRSLLDELGAVSESANVSRIDLYVDFVSSVDMESWKRNAWVTRASSISAYSVGGLFSGWSIGMGGVMGCRLYDKTLEIETSKKDYLRALWAERGWREGERVWRLEFQYRREVLDQKGVQKLYSVLNHLNGLWSYAATEWLKLTLPSETDQTRSRWPIHPLWIALASIDWETDGGPLSKRFSAARAPSDHGLCRMAFSALTSFMAREGEWNFWRAWSLLGERVEVIYGTKAHYDGLPFEQFIQEKVRAKGRKFNTLSNADEIAEEDRLREELDEAARAYRKASRG
ncbi:MAG: replication initiation factor [Zoogloea sp.]|nr:replication initiation factor [Zoogloea sp.]